MDTLTTANHLWLFALLVLGIMLLPGLDMALILGKTLAHGRGDGWAALTGVMLGGVLHVAIAMSGLGLVLQHAAWAFNGLLLAGAAYLAWMGWGLWRSGAMLGDIGKAPEQRYRAPLRSASQGLLTCLLNPKAYVFMLSIFPQFVRPSAGPLSGQAVWMGGIIIGTQALVYGTLILGAGSLRHTLHRHPGRQQLAARGVGLLLMATALWTAGTGLS